MKKKPLRLILLFPILATGFLLINAEGQKCIAQEMDDAKTFKVLKTKMIDPKTGLPKTLDPR